MANETHSQSVFRVSEEYVDARIKFERWLDRFHEVYALHSEPLVGTSSDNENDGIGEEGVFTQAEVDFLSDVQLEDARYYLEEIQEILQQQIQELEEVRIAREGVQGKR